MNRRIDASRKLSAVVVSTAVMFSALALRPAVGAQAEGGAKKVDAVSVKDLEGSLERGVTWLRSRQNPDGGYGPTRLNPRLAGSSDIGLTAFALYALARAPEKLAPRDGRAITGALEFVLARQQPDGSFHDPRDPSLVEYKTSVAMLALVTLDEKKYAGKIEKAQEYLKSRQFVEKQGFSNESPSYGGWGYDLKGQANLSVTKYVAEALFETGLSAGDSVWERVKIYLARTQNAGEVDPVLEKRKVGTTGDWGFRYGPDFTRGPSSTGGGGEKLFSSYGSMTYAGLLSFLYARVDRDDIRVQKAFEWISKNFTVDVNPGMATLEKPELGLQGLFYYYHTMAKALSTYGEPTIVDARGVRHDWARELGGKLVSIQEGEGMWVNEADRWMEGIPTLTTCYAVIAMSICRDAIVDPKKKR